MKQKSIHTLIYLFVPIVFILTSLLFQYGHHTWSVSHHQTLDMMIHTTLELLVMLPFLIYFVMQERRARQQLDLSISKLTESEQRYLTLLQQAPDSILVHADNKITFINEAALNLLGLDSDDTLLGEHIRVIIGDQYNAEDVALVYSGEALYLQHLYTTRPNGEEIVIEYSVVPVRDSGRPAAVVFGRDVTDRIKSDEQIRFQAYHDHLTGLPNRRYFHEELDTFLREGERQQRRVALVYMDLDKFKNINDSFGHHAGDRYLQEIGRRLQQFAAANRLFVSRLGGDEFTLIFPQATDHRQIEDLVHRTIEIIHAPIEMEGYKLYPKASMGIAVYPDHANNQTTLLNVADSALLAAKETRNTYRFYFSAHNLNITEKIRLQNDLERALIQNEFELYYQAKHELKNKQIVGSEALIRWNHPELGQIPPAKFIPIAEEIGLAEAIGNWVTHTACRQIRTWMDQGVFLPVSINVSVRQFQHGRIVETVQEALRQTQIEPSLLELEITESIAMDIDKTLVTLQELNHLGVLISIDDFGTGYSSLSYLKKLPIHQLKIDRSFIRDINNNGDEAIVSTIVALAHNLQLKVVAEGVETAEQVRALEALHCDEGQGYFFHKPMPLPEFQQLIMEAREHTAPIRVPNIQARLKGIFLKIVISSIIASEAKFPEYNRMIEEMEDDAWYSWDLYTQMLQDIERKSSHKTIRKLGEKIIDDGASFFVDELGFDSLEKLLQNYPELFDRTIVHLPDHERVRLISYSPGLVVIQYTTRQPDAFNEGVLRGFFKLFQTDIRSFRREKVNAHYYQYEIEW